jgi:hypothetical protein
LARNGKTENAIAVEACLPSGRACLSIDGDGAAKFTVELSQPEAAKLAAKLDQLMDTTFWVVCTPKTEKY